MELNDAIDIVKGIGPKSKADFAACQIESVGDLIKYYPFRYEDRSFQEYSQLEDGQVATVRGLIKTRPHLVRRGPKSQLIAQIELADGSKLKAVWFNQGYLANNFQAGTEVLITGKYSQKYKNISVQKFEIGQKDKLNIHSGGLIPIYMSCQGQKTKQIRNFIHQIIENINIEEETLAEELIKKYKLLPIKEAYRAIHFPENGEDYRQAYRRLVFEEFFYYQLDLHLYRNKLSNKVKSITRRFDRGVIDSFFKDLPFALTRGQKHAVEDIMTDLAKDKTMYRLLHGDVGSGKTIVAITSILYMWTGGGQSALMAPTEILAEQHYQTVKSYLSNYEINIRLLTSKTTRSERIEILDGLAQGEINLLIGTHALIQEDVLFHDLALAIIDEQHRFGVDQRALLTQKGQAVDLLTMSATPIPRTLAMTIYGDIDITVLDELPANRKSVKTELLTLSKSDLKKIYEKMQELMADGQQIYLVCPMIEVSESVEAKNVLEVYGEIKKVFPEANIGLLHGRMSQLDKDEVMMSFAQGKTEILVATTVVEVGVNVPNASMMVIYNAERFGLTQLHQLRGRVGRGEHPAYTYLLANLTSENSRERMAVMLESNDGFYIAEKDLEIRGPGEIIGARQSGLPVFKLGDIARDMNIMTVAREESRHYLQNRK